jgi:phosphatidylserine/phosphatidylglycerophosphate/cardiolipin synthase-like enzyme
MELADYFLEDKSTLSSSKALPGNDVTPFYDNVKLFAAMESDLLSANGSSDFVYLLNWWCDTELPLGTKTLKEALATITISTNNCQVCAIFWRQKSQPNLAGLPAALVSLPASKFGDPLLSAINTESWKLINGLNNSKAILDDQTAAFGSHHQKLLLIKRGSELVAYVGSTDFNLDRLFPEGAGSSIRKVRSKGAPEQDVHVRIQGPASQALLATFVDRWKLHSDSRGFALRGEKYIVPQTSVGKHIVQVGHTYAKKYPHPGRAVLSAAFGLERAIRSAKSYIYIEDQYLIGNAALFSALRDQLTRNVELTIIGVMTSEQISDLPLVSKRRCEFWHPLVSMASDRVLLYEMLNAAGRADGEGSYLHAKLIIVDDIVAITGSVNFNNRSWYHDSELSVSMATPTEFVSSKNVATGDLGVAANMRISRWNRHLGDAAKNMIFRINDGIAAWKRPPASARVRRWLPQPIRLNDVERTYFEQFVDPQ